MAEGKRQERREKMFVPPEEEKQVKKDRKKGTHTCSACNFIRQFRNYRSGTVCMWCFCKISMLVVGTTK